MGKLNDRDIEGQIYGDMETGRGQGAVFIDIFLFAFGLLSLL